MGREPEGGELRIGESAPLRLRPAIQLVCEMKRWVWGRMCHLPIAVALLLFASGTAHAQQSLEYQNRGNRYEGVRPRPVSGHDIELVSALIDYKDSSSTVTDQVTVKFFLDEQVPVHLTVRELNVNHYYWLDRVRPARPWAAGSLNEFTWAANEVLHKLNTRMSIYELGAVARLTRSEPSADERVAPVVLYHSNPPDTATSYLFAFKTSGDARLVYAVYHDKADKPLIPAVRIKVSGGRAFTLGWNAADAETGRYRLVIEGYLLDTNQRLHQTLRFFHQPTVRWTGSAR
jgi:hypothetical protein